MIGASAFSQDSFSINSICPDFAEIVKTQNWSEMNSLLYVDGQAWAIAEVSRSVKYPLDKTGLSLNELETQMMFPPRQFLILSELGISIFSKLRPIDYLQRLLRDSNGRMTPSLRSFFDHFGLDQSCAMCLAVACDNQYANP